MQHLGLLSILSIFAIIGYVLHAARHKNLRTISHHAASSRRLLVGYTVSITLALTVFSYWVLRWFRHELQLPDIYTVLFTFALVAMTFVILIPTKKGLQSHIHDGFAFLLGSCFLPLIFIASRSENVSSTAQIISYVILAFMIGAILNSGSRIRNDAVFLRMQKTYFTLFLLTFLVFTYF